MSVHQNLRFFTFENACAFQPINDDKSKPAPFLTIQRDSGDLQILDTFDVSGAKTTLDISGILGTIKLHSGEFMVLITAKKKIATLFFGTEHDVYTITDTLIVPVSRKKTKLRSAETSQEALLIELLESICKMGHMYFSYTFDLTHNAQHTFANPSKLPLWQSADQRFLWNRHLLQKFVDSATNKLSKLSDFILPVLCGFVRTVSSSVNHKQFHYTLITRKHTKRVGTRYHSRGIDEQGYVANFVETEQILSFPDPTQMTTQLCSYVQIRGSIPIFWSQRINSKYTPVLEISRKPNSSDVFLKHCNEQCQLYGNNMTFVNLINKKGYELPLGDEFKSQVDRINDKRFNYIHFDFHKECKKMRYDRVSLLMDSLQPALKTQGYFSCTVHGEGAQVQRRQEGVIRTNCIDCLDRTNVVQSAISQRLLLEQMRTISLLGADAALPADFRVQFNHVWADHADVVSFLYAGTHALKTDFTRFGRRTVQGALHDLRSSVRRYFLNNFRDGRRQDALDLFLGVASAAQALASRPSWAARTMHSVLVYAVGFSIFFMLLAMLMAAETLGQAVRAALAFIFLFLLSMWLAIHTYGEAFVQTPTFVPPPPMLPKVVKK